MQSCLQISVVYALAQRQVVLDLELPADTTARQAAVQSGMQEYFPGLDTATVALGVYGEHVSDDYVMQAGDRLELYRDLVMDPMQLRRQRALTAKAAEEAAATTTNKTSAPSVKNKD